MKFTRRQFMHSTYAAAAGLFLPQFAQKGLAHIDEVCVPVNAIQGSPPVSLVYQGISSESRNVQENEYSGYLFSLFGPINTPQAPVMTHREAAIFLGYEDFYKYTCDRLPVDENGLSPDINADTKAELGIYFNDWYYPYGYFEATKYAHWWLGHLQLSLLNSSLPGLEGVEFIDKRVGHNSRFANDCPRFAKALDQESLLRVKKLLEALGIGTIVDYQDRKSSLPISQRERFEYENHDLFFSDDKEVAHEETE